MIRMMKKLLGILTIVVALCSVSCNNMLEIDPISSISPNIYWQSEDDATYWMAGIYHQMQVVLNGNVFDWGEARSDNVDKSGTGIAQTNLTNNQLSSTGNSSTVNWKELYNCIMLCNFGIKYFPKMIEENVDGAEAVYTEYLGQCYAMRAFMYFCGLRVWGRIPIVPDAIESTSEEMLFGRSGIGEVKTQIISDIRKALNTIGTDNSRKFYLNKSSALALLTDVYAWFQEYERVVEVSDTFMTTTDCQWIASPGEWKDIFVNPQNSTETVFTMYWDYLESGNNQVARNIGCSNYSSLFVVRGEYLQKLIDRQDTLDRWSDSRHWQCFDTVQYKLVSRYDSHGINRKFGKFVRWDPNIVNTGVENGAFVYPGNNEANYFMPIYRYADVMSLRAEALSLTSQYDEALNILRTIRNRVGYNPDIQNDSTNFMEYYDKFGSEKGKRLQEVILDERQIEFLCEGKRWYDLCRIGKTIFTAPYYDEAGPPYRIPSDCYEYLRSKVNIETLDRPELVEFEDNNINRVLFPIVSGAFTANPLLRGDQNYPYDE
jgi:hypothetical protein